MVALVGAVAVGLAFGGRWSRLTQLRLQWRALVVAAVLAQGGGALIGIAGLANARSSYVVGLAVSAACGAVFCARNLRIAGVPLLTLGLLCNALVVALNGAMPVSVHAALRAGVPLADIVGDARHRVADAGTTLRPLADIIPVPLPARPEVVSAGDVLVAAGLAELISVGMLRRRADA